MSVDIATSIGDGVHEHINCKNLLKLPIIEGEDALG